MDIEEELHDRINRVMGTTLGRFGEQFVCQTLVSHDMNTELVINSLNNTANNAVGIQFVFN